MAERFAAATTTTMTKTTKEAAVAVSAKADVVSLELVVVVMVMNGTSVCLHIFTQTSSQDELLCVACLMWNASR